MKLLALALLVCALGSGTYFTARPPAEPTAEAAAGVMAKQESAEAPSGEPLHFVGRVIQHHGAQLLVKCQTWKPYLNEGHKAEEVTGLLILDQYPAAKALHDEAEIEFHAQSAGVVTYDNLLGVPRTVRRVVWYDPGQSGSGRQGNWMFDKSGRNSLDRRAR